MPRKKLPSNKQLPFIILFLVTGRIPVFFSSSFAGGLVVIKGSGGRESLGDRVFPKAGHETPEESAGRITPAATAK